MDTYQIHGLVPGQPGQKAVFAHLGDDDGVAYYETEPIQCWAALETELVNAEGETQSVSRISGMVSHAEGPGLIPCTLLYNFVGYLSDGGDPYWAFGDPSEYARGKVLSPAGGYGSRLELIREEDDQTKHLWVYSSNEDDPGFSFYKAVRLEWQEVLDARVLEVLDHFPVSALRHLLCAKVQAKTLILTWDGSELPEGAEAEELSVPAVGGGTEKWSVQHHLVAYN